MSSAIIDFYANDKGAVLANASIARPLELPSDWKFLQIGILFGFTTGSLTDISGNPRWYIGFCSGSTNIVGDSTVGHFMGFRTGDSTITYSSSSTYQNITYYSTITNAVRWSPTQFVVSSDINPGTQYVFTDRNDKKTLNYFQITRSFVGSDLLHFVQYRSNTNGNSTYGRWDETTLLRELQSITPTVLGAEGSLAVGNRANMFFNETESGSLDHLCIAWDKESPNPEMIIYAVGVAVLE
jgi:hypothetical protein